LVEGSVDTVLATAEEILKYAEEGFEKTIKTRVIEFFVWPY